MTRARARAVGVPPRRCRECGGELVCGQPGKHWSCAEICQCNRPVIVDEHGRRHNCVCNKTDLKAAATAG